jgi:transcriptional regulator with XRE-family HTH domain
MVSFKEGTVMKTLGDLLHQGRLAKRLTMSRLAEMAGLSVMYISELENERKVPGRGDALEKIAKCLDLDLKELKESATYSRMRSLMKNKNVNAAEVRFALARKIIQSEISDDQVKSINESIDRILTTKKEDAPS